jgi:hypothetical protein
MKKYVLNLALLISAHSIYSMDPEDTKKEDPFLQKRLAFVVALAEGGASLATIKGNKNQPRKRFIQFHELRGFSNVSVPLNEVPTFLKSSLDNLKVADTKEAAQNAFPFLSQEHVYRLTAAYKVLITKKDLTVFGDERFAADVIHTAGKYTVEHIQKAYGERREALLKVLTTMDPHNVKVVKNVETMLGLPMQPWVKPLHLLVLEKIEAGQLKKAE